MGDRLRVLILEDRPSDAELVADALRQSGLEFDWKRVDRKPDYLAALEDKPDVVLADYNVPGFGALDALDATRERGSDVPVIIITGSLGDEIAAECIKRGASDYLLKDRLSRLGPAVEKALERKRLREEARQAEGALRESEAKFRELIEQASDGIFVTDTLGNFKLVNSRFCEMLGYGEQELLRLNTAATYVEAERGLLAQRLANLGEVKSRLFERMMRRRDGSLFPIEVSIRRLSTGLNQGIVRDITERKKAQEALTESEQRFRQLAENVREVFFLTDPANTQTFYVSPAYESVFGRSVESIYAKPASWGEVIHPDDREAMAASFKRRLETGKFDDTFRVVRPDGSVRWIRGRGFPVLDASGKPYRVAGIAEDITESKVQQDRIARLTRVHAVLSGINAVIVRAKDKDELFREACRIAVEDGRFQFAWLGVVDREAMGITTVASAGKDAGFLDTMKSRLSLKQAPPQGHGPAARAVLDKQAVFVNDVVNDSRILRKADHLERGIRSVGMLPLVVSGEAVGVLALHAAEVGFFDEEETKLLLELAGDISFALEHIQNEEKLNYLAYYDSLTGLANRDLFHERLTQSVRSASRDQRKLALIVMDIERFKAINDSFGRQAGDELLRQFAAGLVRVMGDPTRLARVGGDHFIAILRDLKAEDGVARFYEERLREYFAQPFRIGNHELRISAKAGIAIFPNDGADAETLFRNAEAALKKAKASGERYLFYTQKMTERIAERLALESKLRQALEKEEFVLHYQPKFEAETSRVEGVEALIRWQSPELGLVPPMQFIPLLEETGLIFEVGAWALRQAAFDHRRWRKLGLAAPRVAVNVSPVQVRRSDFVESVRKVLGGDTGAPPVDLEITESLIMEDVEASIEKLQEVRLLGVEIAIDDFGTGYSSLGYLAKLPVQTLKIDRSFIITMLKDPAAMTLVSTIISMAHSLRLKVVAEGVDSEDQASALRRLGCDQMQGFLFSKPLPFNEMTALLGSGAGKHKARRKN